MKKKGLLFKIARLTTIGKRTLINFVGENIRYLINDLTTFNILLISYRAYIYVNYEHCTRTAILF